MKKIISLLFAALVAAMIFVSCGTSGSAGNGETVTINVYNWGENISDGTDGSLDVIDEFEKRYPNIKVNYTTYETNEAMYAKIKSGGGKYDVVIPSDYMINRMIEEDMLEKLDFDNIPNYENIMDSFKDDSWSYDPDHEYSVPYTWGTVGILYNKAKVNKTVDSWDILWDEDYKGQILMFDNSRDAFGVAAKKLGYSQNTTDEKELNACADELKKQKDVVQAYVMDQIFDKMINGEAAIAPYYAGDALTIIDSNPDIEYVIPKEGSNKFVDAMVIPKGTEHKKEAETFINFMCETDIALENINYINYSTPLKTVYDELDEERRNNKVAYPDEASLVNCEEFKNLPKDVNTLIENLWIQVKAS